MSETRGEVYFGVLAYSGNFKIVEEQTPYDYLNIQIGMGDTDFCWNLKKGERFISPKVYAGYSGKGFGEMSNPCWRSRIQKRQGRQAVLWQAPKPVP